ncbi:MAG: hypothetical protein J6J71_00990 [Prevotella sp.]|nr:hypothetical protein [Prevotella sp.]
MKIRAIACEGHRFFVLKEIPDIMSLLRDSIKKRLCPSGGGTGRRYSSTQ